MTETADESGASHSVPGQQVRTECLALTALTGLLAIAWFRLVHDGTIVGQDAATQFYPWYSYLGQRLRQLDLPLWNPAQFAGAPFAADPQSGWTYLPAMILFTLLPLASAANSYLLVHLALAGYGSYALARALAISPTGALTAGVAYGLSGLVYGRSVCCPAQLQAAAWVPVLLLGAELSFRKHTFRARIASWSLAGLALSQILASWLGQVSYYALLLLGAYLVYRTLIDPPARGESWPHRFSTLALSAAAIGTIGFGLAAAGILPRLDYNRLTNVAGGIYDGGQAYAATLGGWSAERTPLADFTRSLYYPGGSVAALALMAIVVARWRHASGFFASVIIVALVLAMDRTTPLHWLLYRLLPRFADLHQHWPERIAIVTFIAPAMLAGICVSTIAARALRPRTLIGAAVLALAILGTAATSWHLDVIASWIAVGAALLIVTGAIALACWRTPRLTTIVAVMACFVVAGDLLLAGPRILSSGPYGGFHRLDLTGYFAPTGAVRFLRERQREAPFRFIGYDPGLSTTTHGVPVLYRNQFASQEALDLIVNNRATAFGLQDVQGYNPVQNQRFVDYLTALNGTAQDYHDANILPNGLTSPLLDLLNVRFIVIPATIPPERSDLTQLVTALPVVYRDDSVQIVENREALPRAWIVHDVVQRPAHEALSLLASGTIDPRSTAVVESAPPAVQSPGGAPDTVVITEWQPETITLAVTTSAPGLLVLSEVATPGWAASIDGKKAPVLQTNYLFRGIPIPAGTHTVSLRYRQPFLSAGLLITGVTGLGIAMAMLLPTVARRTRPLGTRHQRLRPAGSMPAVATTVSHDSPAQS